MEEMEGIKKYLSLEQKENQEKFAELSRKMSFVRETLTSGNLSDEPLEMVKKFNIEFKNKCLELKKTNPEIKTELRDYSAGKALYGNPLTDELGQPFDTDDFDIEKFIDTLHDFVKNPVATKKKSA